MSKQDIIYELNKLEYSILAASYIEDDDGTEGNTKIVLNRFAPMNEKDVRYILDKITKLIQKIKESE